MARQTDKSPQRPNRAAPVQAHAGTAAGLGTGFAGVVSLLPDGRWKSILLILAPAITVIISSSWQVLTEEVGSRVADWRIKNQRKRAQRLRELLAKDASASDDMKRQAQENLEAVMLIELQISKERVDAMGHRL